MSDKPSYSLLLDWMTESLTLAPTAEPVPTGVIWNDGGVITLSVGIPPTFTTHPQSIDVIQGSTASFTWAADNATSYQVQKQESGAGAWANVSGATSSPYTTGALTIAADSTDKYRVVATGPGGTTTSNEATLTVTGAVLPSGVVSKMTAIYGTARLVNGYAGVGVKLRRISDNTLQDFSFEADGTLSKSAIDSFMGASQLRIQQWYDQTGNGNHLIASATAGERPGFRFDRANNPVVSFSDFANMPVIAGPENMVCATGALAARNVSVSACGRWLDQSDSQNHNGPPAWQLGSGSTDCIEYSSATNVNTSSPVSARYRRRILVLNGAFKTMNSTDGTGIWANTGLSSEHVRSEASGCSYKWGAWFSRTNTAGTAVSTTGITLGMSFGGSFRSCAHVTAWMAGTPLTGAEETAVDNVYRLAFNAVVTPTRQVVIEGDSISAAYNNSLYDDREFGWPFAVQNNLGTGVLVRNTAISGGHIAGTVDGGTRSLQFGEQAPDKIDAMWDATSFSAGQLLVVWAGTNDIGLKSGVAGDGTTVHTRLSDYCLARKTAHPTLKILVVGPIPRGPFSAGQDTQLAAYDTLMAANYATYADGYVSMLDQNWTPSGSYATNYLADEIHPNATGHAKAAAIIEPVIRTVLGL